MEQIQNASKDFFEKLEGIIQFVQERDGKHFFKFPEGYEVDFSTMSEFLELYKAPEGDGLYNIINKFCVVFIGEKFEYLLDRPTITAFSFKVQGNILEAYVETLSSGRFHVQLPLVGVTDRRYLCRLLSEITVNLPITRYYQRDFVYSLKDKKLELVFLDET